MNNPSILLQTLSNIDWEQLSGEITPFAKFHTNKEIIVHNPKIYDKEKLDEHYQTISILIKKIEEGVNTHEAFFGALNDNNENHDSLNYISKDGVASLTQLNFLANMLQNIHSFRKILSFGEYKDTCESFVNQTQRLKTKFVTPLRKFVDADGSIHLERHPIIAPLIREQENLKVKIRETIQYLLKDEDISPRLQMVTFDIINERFVIPIRSDSYRSDIGSIVSRSSTGHTLFVEPVSTRKMANTLIELNSKIDYEVSNICRGFTQTIKSDLEVMFDLYNFTIELDYINTLTHYSLAKSFTKPILSDEETILKDFYHPLIPSCVRNSLDFTKYHKGLIISGPNTGGKTVSIKSMVIAHLYLKLGIYIPASQAQLSYKNDIFYFDSDYQNLEEGLSSFAGEVQVILSMLENIESNSLIAADEIFNSTSSDEASALAYSIVKHLTEELNCQVLISTHHQLLKTKVQETQDFISAHVGYNFEENSPTYKLIIGTPGSSMALEIFKRLSKTHNIPSFILDNAKHMLDSKYVTYEKLLQDLSKKQSKIDKTLRENIQLNHELRNQKKSQEGVLFLEKEKAFNQFQKEIRKIISGLNDIKSKSLNKEITQLNKKFENLKPNKSNKQSIESSSIKPKELIVNNTYFCELFSSSCTLVELKSKNAIVLIKGKKVNVPKSSLFIKEGQKISKPTKSKVEINVFKTHNTSTEINCRGMRLSDFQNKVFSCLEDLRLGVIPYLIIVHGHGEGTLKKWLRSELKRNKELQWTPDEGNDGATRIELVN